ncbi:MAG: cellulase family glycosylhydrolase [Caldilineales bacterium]|nr:cellulase family glycosylhydrolase [Caldilineales bacterium]
MNAISIRKAKYFLTGMLSTSVLLALLVGASMLGGCQSTAEPTPTPTKTPMGEQAQATATAVPDSSLAEPTAATPGDAAPSDTPIPPTEAPAEQPTTDAGQAVDTPVPPTPTTAPKPAADGVMRSPDFGAQAFLWWRPEVADRDLQLMEDAGFNWVKQWFAWQDIEGAGRGQYDWSRTDRIVDQVADHGLNLLVRLSPAADKAFWAGEPPESTDAFAEFAGEVARRYKGRIHAYQIWNEPNLSREWGNKAPDPASYAQMLRKSYQAIKAADPNAIVVTAGMAPTTADQFEAMYDTKFYDLMYQAMGGNSDGYFDMLGVHGAGYAVSPETDPAQIAGNPAWYNNDPSGAERVRVYSFRHIEDIRKIMEKYGDSDKKVVVLEFGWTFDPRTDSPYYWHGQGAGIDMFVQADYLKRAYQYAAANWPWIGLMSLIYMPDSEWKPETEQYYWSIMDPSPPGQTFWRPAYIVLCDYMNRQQGGECIHDPARQ